MTTLKDMSVSEAASKALEVILAGSYLEMQVWRKANGYSVDEGTWQDSLRTEYDLDEDSDFSNLEEVEQAWKEAKYEGGSDPHTVDGWTAKVEAEHGGEGQGDQYWVVISVSDGETTRYFRKNGWYASYDGGYLDGDTTEVSPQEKTVVVYE